jgi:hypothetical protein
MSGEAIFLLSFFFTIFLSLSCVFGSYIWCNNNPTCNTLIQEDTRSHGRYPHCGFGKAKPQRELGKAGKEVDLEEEDAIELAKKQGKDDNIV